MTDEERRMTKFSAAIDAMEAIAVQDPGRFDNRPLVEALFAEIGDLCIRARTAEHKGDLPALNGILAEGLLAMARFAELQRDLDA